MRDLTFEEVGQVSGAVVDAGTAIVAIAAIMAGALPLALPVALGVGAASIVAIVAIDNGALDALGSFLTNNTNVGHVTHMLE